MDARERQGSASHAQHLLPAAMDAELMPPPPPPKHKRKKRHKQEAVDAAASNSVAAASPARTHLPHPPPSPSLASAAAAAAVAASPALVAGTGIKVQPLQRIQAPPSPALSQAGSAASNNARPLQCIQAPGSVLHGRSPAASSAGSVNASPLISMPLPALPAIPALLLPPDSSAQGALHLSHRWRKQLKRSAAQALREAEDEAAALHDSDEEEAAAASSATPQLAPLPPLSLERTSSRASSVQAAEAQTPRRRPSGLAPLQLQSTSTPVLAPISAPSSVPSTPRRADSQSHASTSRTHAGTPRAVPSPLRQLPTPKIRAPPQLPPPSPLAQPPVRGSSISSAASSSHQQSLHLDAPVAPVPSRVAGSGPMDMASIIQLCIRGGRAPPPSTFHSACAPAAGASAPPTSPLAREKGSMKRKRSPSGSDDDGSDSDDDVAPRTQAAGPSLHLSQHRSSSQAAPSVKESALQPAPPMSLASSAAAAAQDDGRRFLGPLRHTTPYASGVEEAPESDPLLPVHTAREWIPREHAKAHDLIRMWTLRRYAAAFKLAFDAMENHKVQWKEERSKRAAKQSHPLPAQANGAGAAASVAEAAAQNGGGAVNDVANVAASAAGPVSAATAVPAAAGSNVSSASSVSADVDPLPPLTPVLSPDLVAPSAFLTAYREMPPIFGPASVIPKINAATAARMRLNGRTLLKGRIDVMLYRALRSWLLPVISLLVELRQDREVSYRRELMAARGRTIRAAREKKASDKRRAARWARNNIRATRRGLAEESVSPDEEDSQSAPSTAESSTDASDAETSGDEASAAGSGAAVSADPAVASDVALAQEADEDLSLPRGGDRVQRAKHKLAAAAAITAQDVHDMLTLLNRPTGFEEGTSRADQELEEQQTKQGRAAAAASANDAEMDADRPPELLALDASSAPSGDVNAADSSREPARIKGAAEKHVNILAPPVRGILRRGPSRTRWTPAQVALLESAWDGGNGVSHRSQHAAARRDLVEKLGALAPAPSAAYPAAAASQDDPAPAIVDEARVTYWFVNRATKHARAEQRAADAAASAAAAASGAPAVQPLPVRKGRWKHKEPKAAAASKPAVPVSARLNLGLADGDDDNAEHHHASIDDKNPNDWEWEYFVRWEDLTPAQQEALEKRNALPATESDVKSKRRRRSHSSEEDEEDDAEQDADDDDEDAEEEASGSDGDVSESTEQRRERRAERKARKAARRERKRLKREKRERRARKRQRREQDAAADAEEPARDDAAMSSSDD